MAAAGAGDSPDTPEGAYKAPAQKSVAEILSADTEDESLKKYKESLLGANAQNIVIEPNNPLNVIVRSMTLKIDGRPDAVIDLSDPTKLNEGSLTIKEGVQFRLQIAFHVQREIVAGLKYMQKLSRKGIPVDKDDFMVGSYGPKSELQTFITPQEEAPSGMMHRGTYKVKSLFTDDDKVEYLKWEWNLEIKKDWE